MKNVLQQLFSSWKKHTPAFEKPTKETAASIADSGYQAASSTSGRTTKEAAASIADSGYQAASSVSGRTAGNRSTYISDFHTNSSTCGSLAKQRVDSIYSLSCIDSDHVTSSICGRTVGSRNSFHESTSSTLKRASEQVSMFDFGNSVYSPSICGGNAEEDSRPDHQLVSSTLERGAEKVSLYTINEDGQSNAPVDIILFCDTDASLFKAIVKHHSSELDGTIANELGYLNLHHRRRTECGLVLNYLEFEYFSNTDGRFYRITRFDTLEDAARFLLSEPYKERGAVLVCPARDCSSSCKADGEVKTEMAVMAKALIRHTLGFSCVAVLFDEPSILQTHDVGRAGWQDRLMNFSGNGIVEKGFVTRVEGSSKAMLDARRGQHPKQNAWWCPSPVEQLQSMLSFFHFRLPQRDVFDEVYANGELVKTRHISKVLTARFYCFSLLEGGSSITALTELKISIAGNVVAEGHIVDSPGSVIEPGKLCPGNVLVLLQSAVPADSRDQFVARRMDGTSVGVGIIVSCS